MAENTAPQVTRSDDQNALGPILVLLVIGVAVLMWTLASVPRMPPPEPSVRIVQPADGATVPTTFTVLMFVEGMTVEPAGEIREGAGHLHILVDTDFVLAGQIIPRDEQHLHYGDGSTQAEITLTPGTHTLRLQFADGAHQAFEGEGYTDEITVTVTE
jgi:hypothetical protein